MFFLIILPLLSNYSYFCALKTVKINSKTYDCFMIKELKILLNRINLWLFPDKEKRKICLFFILLFFFKIFWFNYCWCSISTFRPFSFPETYVLGILFALILVLPFLFFRSVWTMWTTDILLGALLISNLIYFRTYYTAIPLSSYILFGNMKDFTSSIYGSFRFEDILFPLSTIVAVFLYLKFIKTKKNFTKEMSPGISGKILLLWRYMSLVTVFIIIAGTILFTKGGFKKAYEMLQDSYTHTCGTPMYTVIGSMLYDYIRDKEYFTPEIGSHIEDWAKTHKEIISSPSRRYNYSSINTQSNDSINMFSHDNGKLITGMNCIIILAESLESWVLEQKVEGQEIMPEMNRLLRDSTTLYAPYVLSQVKGGRSVDAQLMLNTGLLPINTGTYSLKYPNSLYPSFVKAMKEKHGKSVCAYTLTADKPMVWNQNIMLPKFGYDSLVSKTGFIQDEKVGPHYRHQLGDVSLLRQCVEKINSNEVWQAGVNILQIVTYSGHFPFTIPDNMKKISFSDNVPGLMRDYMSTANYTDRALGLFVDSIKSNPEFDNTLIIIVGDHEGLADMRDEFCSSDAGQGIVSEYPFVPLIIANIPDSLRSVLYGIDIFKTTSDDSCNNKTPGCMRYNKVMGQIDIYPTLLDLLNLTDYQWTGLGFSILNPEKPGIAIDPYGKVYGDTTVVSPAIIFHLGEAWRVSDEIIRYNYFAR